MTTPLVHLQRSIEPFFVGMDLPQLQIAVGRWEMCTRDHPTTRKKTIGEERQNKKEIPFATCRICL
jgi:hypothetical protein